MRSAGPTMLCIHIPILIFIWLSNRLLAAQNFFASAITSSKYLFCVSERALLVHTLRKFRSAPFAIRWKYATQSE